MRAAVPRLYLEPMAIAAMPTRTNRTPAQKSFGSRMRTTTGPGLRILARKDSIYRIACPPPQIRGGQ